MWECLNDYVKDATDKLVITCQDEPKKIKNSCSTDFYFFQPLLPDVSIIVDFTFLVILINWKCNIADKSIKRNWHQKLYLLFWFKKNSIWWKTIWKNSLSLI